jgi:hypothetical protein
MVLVMQLPPNIPMLDLQLKEFYQLIGQCIKAWATVEDKLFDVCEKLLKTERHFVSVIFFRTPSIDARVKLTHELLAVHFPKIKKGNRDTDHPVLAEWKGIKTKIERLLPERNSLAHHPVRMNIQARNLTSFETSPSQKERLRGKEVKPVEDIKLSRHLKEVNGISQSLEKFISELGV